MTDPYQVLGIPSSATDDEVKAAYRKMAKVYHPDRNGGSAEAEKKMMQVNEAYETIMDMRKNGGRSSQQSGYGAGYGNAYGNAYGGYSQQGYSSSQAMQTARQYIAFGQYYQAVQILENMSERTAYWYYLSAQARAGLGDNIAALNHARQAANMEPGNADYADLVSQLTSGGQQYREQGVQYGGMHSVCNNPLLACLLCNCCCGGRGFWFFPCL